MSKRNSKLRSKRKAKEAPVVRSLLFDFGDEDDATEYTVEEDSLLPK